MKKTYIIFAIIAAVLSSCITDTVDSMSKFTVQIPIFYETEYIKRMYPDVSIEFTNLNKYAEYKENKDKIEKAEVFQFNYRIDSIVLPNDEVYNPDIHDLRFEYIRYKIIFAKPKTTDEDSQDSSKFEIDTSIEPVVLGEFRNVDIKDFYRQSKNVKTIGEKETQAISDIIKGKPYFYISTEYSNRLGGYPAKELFPYVNAKFDVVVRLGIKI